MAAMHQAIENRPYCRICGTVQGLDPHHIVPRSLTQCDDQDNLCVLCRGCHDSVHRKDTELGSYLSVEEQAKAVMLTGSLTLACKLLYPRTYAGEVTFGVGWPE
jgi:hypothetical protein